MSKFELEQHRLSSKTRFCQTLAARLEASGGLVECWKALNELKSCINKIVLFFVNGQTDFGPDRCRAIEVITSNCWPAMLTSLAFKSEEGNILRGYCDASPGPAAVPPLCWLSG
ncbi:hypothetical protein CRYUN_Cryun22dG0062300 [Craigia yunnanensis]